MTKKKSEYIKFVFWLKSSRGTNEKAVVSLPRGLSFEDKKAELESWCGQFGAWHHGDNSVRYGWRYAKNQSMTYADFLKKVKIKPDITTAERAHKLVFEELIKNPFTSALKKKLKRVLMSMWCRHSSLAKKYHTAQAEWIIDDCVKALQPA